MKVDKKRWAAFYSKLLEKNALNLLVSHHINSYNDFVLRRVQRIIDEIGEVELSQKYGGFKLVFGKVRFGKPFIKEADGFEREITPMEARIRNLNYTCPLMVEVTPIIGGIEKEQTTIKICDFPIMINSVIDPYSNLSPEEKIELGEDPTDPGGYFIINGVEKVIVGMEEVANDRPVITIEEKKGIEMARINSEREGYIQRHMLERRDRIIYLSFSNLRQIPLVVLLRALGLSTDQQIMEAIADCRELEEEVLVNIYEFEEVKSRQSALKYLEKKYIKGYSQKEISTRLQQILNQYLLPHLGTSEKDQIRKAYYLAHVVNRLMKVGLGMQREDDIDHLANKRITLAGDFLDILLRSLLLGKQGLAPRIKYNYVRLSRRKKIPAIGALIESNYITKRIISALATGSWVGGRTGVAQRLDRTNYIRRIVMMRAVISPLSASQEHAEARELHATHWGRLCLEETPEGAKIGLRKHLANLVTISNPADERSIKDMIDIISDKISKEGKGTIIFLNGNILGHTTHPKEVVRIIREARRAGKISNEINVVFFEELNEIRINTEGNRLRRPLIIVKDGRPLLTEEHIQQVIEGKMDLNDLVKEGVVEYLDAEEEENAYIALWPWEVNKEHTHLELNPACVLGIPALMVPFANRNRGDRVNYGSKMSSQALGIYATNYLLRTDTKAYTLVYPQKPLVKTAAYSIGLLDKHPQGQNVIVALSPYLGYNVEDAIVINKSSIDRGLFRSLFFRSYVTEERKYWGIESDEIKIPNKSCIGYSTEEDYTNLEEDGIVKAEAEVKENEVLIGKESPVRFYGPRESFFVEAENKKDASVRVRFGEAGVVDRVFVTQTDSGNKLVKVILREVRIPEIGDKFASRYGQKGVIGAVVPQEDLPYTESGIIPDLIVNPLCIPSRMTVGQLLEMIYGKAAALIGKEMDATVFNEEPEEAIANILKRLGFKEDGTEVMYDPFSGKKMKVRILIGPIYYQRLYHMVADKWFMRARGPTTILTRQPTEGKAREGGLRFGEMEKDCLLAHGAVMALKDRFSSDETLVPICKKCGLVAVYDRISGKKFCPLCGKKADIVLVKMSYAFKLFLDELKSMCVYPKVEISEEE